MIVDSTHSLKGSVRLELKDETGKVIDERFASNVVVNVGKNFLANWLTLSSTSTPFMGYIALGTSTTPALNTDTGLGAEIAGSRVLGTLSATQNIWQNTVTIPVLVGTGMISEVGLFNQSVVAGSTMFAHQVFAASLTKNPNNTLTITWQITFN